jgi:hypothetical protein
MVNNVRPVGALQNAEKSPSIFGLPFQGRKFFTNPPRAMPSATMALRFQRDKLKLPDTHYKRWKIKF